MDYSKLKFIMLCIISKMETIHEGATSPLKTHIYNINNYKNKYIFYNKPQFKHIRKVTKTEFKT